MTRLIGVQLLSLVLFIPRDTWAGDEVPGPLVRVQEGDVMGRTVVFSENTFTNITDKHIDVFQVGLISQCEYCLLISIHRLHNATT